MSPSGSDRIVVVGIGASAGGLEAVTQLLERLDPKLPCAYVLLQHLSPSHRSLMVEILARETSLAVQEAQHGARPQAGVVYVVPATSNATLREGRLQLTAAASESVPKPSVNTFLISLAADAHENAIGIVLSGTGSDGTAGLRAVQAAGGTTIAQRPDTAKYDGMPRAAIDAGVADLVLTPAEIAAQLPRLVEHGNVPVGAPPPDLLEALLAKLKQRMQLDFSGYKLGTLMRRIRRRISATGMPDLAAYVAQLDQSPQELERLARDILISVTSFFRDREAFAELGQAIEALCLRKPLGAEFRVWVAGCATGEEAYSIAILFAQALGDRLARSRVQIFATDIDEQALAVARRGAYAAAALAEVPPQLLNEHFRPQGSGYEVAPHLRDMIVFARHNLVSDPPFLRLDLVTCRNVLIYFDAPLQTRVFQTFHFGLQAAGLLFLGRSESVTLAEQLFVPVNRRERLFQKSGELGALVPAGGALPTAQRLPTPRRDRRLELMLAGLADELDLTAALCDQDGQVLHAVGSVERYFQFPAGPTQTALSEVAVPALRGELLRLLQRCRTTGEAQRGRRRRIARHAFRIHVRRTGDSAESGLLVLFERLEREAQASAATAPDGHRGSAADEADEADEAEGRIADEAVSQPAPFDDELQSTREHLEALSLQMATVNEEMQALNEEAQASNEELQATNEELEAANQELQATNEELVSVNEEINRKSSEIARLAEEYAHLYDALQFPILVFDRSLQLMRFNVAAGQLLDLRTTALRQSAARIRWPRALAGIEAMLLEALGAGDSQEKMIRWGERSLRAVVAPGVDRGGQVVTLVFSLVDISDVADAQMQLAEAQTRLAALMDNTQVLFAMKDLAGQYVFANRRFRQFFGMDEAAPLVGRTDFELLPNALAADLWAADMLALRERTPQTRVHRLSGASERWLRSVHTTLVDASGTPTAFAVEAEDVSNQHEAERQMRITARVFDQSGDAILVMDAQGIIETANAAFVTKSGYAASELAGKGIALLRSDRHSDEFYQRQWRELQQHGFWQGEVWSRRKGGESVAEWVSISRIDGQDGQPEHLVAVYADIASLKGSQRKTDYLATHDALTGLPNRELFHDRLKQALAQARRSKHKAAVLFIDLDHFKTVNDTQGHDAGDALLRQVAGRLGHAVRDVDTVARLGGDEFTVILSECDNDSAEQVARRILEELALPLRVGDREVFVGASVGVAMYPDDGADSASLIKAADSAMYGAKELGRNRLVFFKPSLQARLLRHAAVEDALREGVRSQRLTLAFQPKFSLRAGEAAALAGAEALVRWTDDLLGEMAPTEFVGIAEASGLIVQLGREVNRMVVRQIAAWRQLDLQVPVIAINVSPRSIREIDFAHELILLLDEHGVPHTQVQVEITEGALLETSSAVRENLAALDAAGIAISIDDFGTGYSSLGYLKHLPLAELKIDRSFVRGLGRDREDEAIARAVLGLAHALHLRTVAEGVEDEPQRRWLAEHGCDAAQGFLFARPLPPEQFEDLIARTRH